MIHRSAGMDDRRLALAALIEIILLIAAALSVVAASLLVELPEVLRPWSGVLVPALLVLVSAAVAAAVAAPALRQALSSLQPLVLIVPDLHGRAAVPDLAARLRAQLGLEL